MIADALAFPFRRDNAAFVALGTVLCSLPPLVAWFLPALPYVGVIVAVLEGFVVCYTLIYFQSVLESGTRGEERLPMWPEEVDVQSLVEQAFQVILPLVISFLPLIVFAVIQVFHRGSWEWPGSVWAVAAGLFLVGAVYLPVALLICSFYGEGAVFNVVGATRSIARMGWEYFLVVAILLGLLGAYSFLSTKVWRLPLVLAAPIASFFYFYAMIASMRAVGRLYARHRDRLDWE